MIFLRFWGQYQGRLAKMFLLPLSSSQFTTAVLSMEAIQEWYFIYLKFEFQKAATAKRHVFCKVFKSFKQLPCNIKVHDSQLPTSKFVSSNPSTFSYSSLLVLIYAFCLETRIQISVHRWIIVKERIVVTSLIFGFLSEVPVK